MTKQVEDVPPLHPDSGQTPMLMSHAEFRAAYPAENHVIEWKSGASNAPLQKAIVSFSNSQGGVVLIGVDDQGAVVGRPKTAGIIDAIHEAAMATHDPGQYWIHELLVDSTAITVLSVARRKQGFAQTSTGQVLVRKGARSIPLMGGELRGFISSRSLERFDMSDSGTPLERADQDALSAIGSAFGWSEERLGQRLVEAGLAVRDGSRLMMTVAGALLLLSEPAFRFGKAYIEILRFPSHENEYDRREELRGPAQEQITQAARFVAGELGTDIVITGLRRFEIPKLPEVVLREAIANAVAHRNYEEVGRCIRVELYPDEVVIVSPGGLPEPVTEQNIRDTQSARNTLLLDALRRMRLAEDLGRGVDVIQDSMAAHLLDPPKFQDLGHSVRVTLPIRSPISLAERAWVQEVEHKGEIEPRDRILLVHAARGEILTNARVRDLVSVDRHDARLALHRLRDAGFLGQAGTRGGTSYVLSASIPAPPSFHLSSADLSRMVLELARERGEISNADVRAATGLDRVETLRLLDSLVREGSLVRSGERRGTRYQLNRKDEELFSD